MLDLRRLAGAGLALGLAACAPVGEQTSADGDAGQIAALTDDCGAGARQGLVGQSAGVLDPSSFPEGTRVLFPGMAATMDFAPGRMNVEVGGDDRVARVYCG